MREGGRSERGREGGGREGGGREITAAHDVSGPYVTLRVYEQWPSSGAVDHDAIVH